MKVAASKRCKKLCIHNKMRMMKKIVAALFLALGLIAFNNKVEASHIAGGDITYECLGGDTYRIMMNIFRDCSGATAPQTITVSLRSTCGGTAQVNMQLQRSPFVIDGDTIFPSASNGAIEVSQLCPQRLNQSRCNGFSNPYPGMEQYVFIGTAVLRPRCNTWNISHTIVCCRNTNRNLTSSTSAIVARLNSQTDSCNSSPRFASQPIPYVCAGQPVVYNFGVTEPDGDSLVYRFIAGYSNWNIAGNTGTNNIFRAPYSATSPLAGITINQRNGRVSFTPTITGNWVLVVEVSEYDRNGNLLGTVMRDILFVVQTCTNQQPRPRAPIQNFTGSGSQIDSNSIEVCIGENFTFNVTITDPNQNDSLTLRSNVTKVLPGATFTWTSTGDTAVATISWTATPVNGLFYGFFIEADDGACPIPGLFYATYNITIVESTYAGPDLTICQNSQSANITVVGGNSFTWRALPGGSGLNVPTNFSCDTCKNVQASPNITTTYEVTSNLSGTCKNVDTITVRVVPDFTLTVTPDDTICNIDTVPLSAVASDPNQNYSYKWSPRTRLSSDTISNPEIRNLNVTQTYRVVVTSDSGCIKDESVKITVADPFPIGVRAIASDTLICLSDTVDFSVNMGRVPVTTCGPAIYPCQGFNSTRTYGNATSVNGQTSYTEPAPYAGFFPSARQQYLYRAADLRAAGMTAGRISSLGFFVSNLTGVNPFFNNYTIKMSCTPLRELTSTWVTGLTEVHSAKTVTLTNGWNTHQFDQAYNWDGTSNLIVEICFDNMQLSPNRTRHAATRYTTTTYRATASGYDFAGGGCFVANQYFLSPFTAIPNTQFTICSGIDPAGYTFNWFGSNPTSPNGFFTATNIGNPRANVNLNTSGRYSVAIQDTLGVCFDTVSIDVNVVSRYPVRPRQVDPFCIDSGFSRLYAPTSYNILPRPGGGFWSGPGIFNDSLGLFDPQLAGKGSHIIKYEVRGDACAAIDSLQIDVVGRPDPTFAEGPFCEKDAINTLDTNAAHLRGYFIVRYGPGLRDTSNNLDATNPNINAPGSVPVTYWAYNGCWKDTTISVQIDKQFDATIPAFGPYCANDRDTVQLNAADPGGSWTGKGIVSGNGLFVPSRAGIGSHTITVDSVGYCGNTGTTTIIVPDTIQPTILDPGPMCDDGSASWSQPVEVFGVPSRGRWGSSGTPPWMPFTTQALFVPSAVTSVGGFGSYPLYYTVFDTISQAPRKICRYSDTLDIVFAKSPEAPTVIRDYHFCEGERIAGIKVNYDSLSNNEVIWFIDPTNVNVFDTIGNQPVLNTSDLARNDGFYYARQKDPNGCLSASVPVPYFVHGNPVAKFEVNPTKVQMPGEIQLINRSDEESAPFISPDVLTKYQWSFWRWGYNPIINDYTFPANRDTTANIIGFAKDTTLIFDGNGYASNWGFYTVELRVETEWGCWAIDTLTFEVDPIIDFEIPNVFTPGAGGAAGDGVNDFFIRGDKLLGLESLDGVIYNRWGRKVYEFSYGVGEFPSDASQGVWDGGKSEDGVYYYVINIKTLADAAEEQVFKGWVTLIRERN